jgi:hypothetical protein
MILFGGGFWLVRNHLGRDEPLPTITSEAADISDESHAELDITLARHRQRLQRIREEIERQQARPWLGMTVSRARAEEILRQLDAIETVVDDPSSNGFQLRQSALELDSLWQERYRSLRDFLATTRVAPLLPAMPARPANLLARFPRDARVTAYYQEYLLVQEQVERLNSVRLRAYDTDLSGRAERVKRATWMRYRCLNRLSELGASLLMEDPARWWREVRFELHTYPTRKQGLWYLTLAKYRQTTGGGAAWAMRLAGELALSAVQLLLLVLALGWALRATRNQPPSLAGALPWAVAWAVATAVEWKLMSGLCEALRPLAATGALYARYRAYLQIAEGPLLTLVANSSLGQRVGVRTYARKSLRWLGVFFLIEGCTGAVILALAAPGILLLSVQATFALLLQILILWGAWMWRHELAWALRHMMPGSMGKLAARGCESPWLGWLIAPLSLPWLLSLALLYSLVRWSNRFEWGRQLSAQVLRRWMEASSDGPGPQYFPLPDGYRDAFLAHQSDPLPAWDQADAGFRASLESMIQEWLERKNLEACVLLHGPFGTGRSAVLKHLESHFQSRLMVVSLPTPERICSTVELLRWLAAGLGADSPKSLDDLAAQMDRRPPTLVLLPQAHRLFLSTVEGFGAFRTLTRLIARCRRNLFWCPVLPSQSMHYVHMALSGEASLVRSLRFPRWTENALREMILAHHQATDRPHRFAPAVMRAAEATPGATAEGHYFRVLREVSAGNPTLARDLWLASAKVDPEGVVVTGLPPRNPPYVLPGLPLPATFLLASLMRHGDLTREEAILSTGLPENQVFLAWERCLELGLLFALSEERACLSRHWLLDVSHYLKERNLLDGQ